MAGEERFKPHANQDRVGELELLQQYLQTAAAKVDTDVASKVAPLERMRRLLTAPDKRATLLDMAGALLPAAARKLQQAAAHGVACTAERTSLAGQPGITSGAAALLGEVC